MTYAESYEKLQQAKRDGAAEIRIEINEGEFTVTIDEALEAFNALAPGEWFEIVDRAEADEVEAAFEEASRAVPAEDLRFIRETYQEDGGEAAERYCDRLADGSVLTARISALGRLGYVLGRSGRPTPAQDLPSHADGTCGCTNPYCQA